MTDVMRPYEPTSDWFTDALSCALDGRKEDAESVIARMNGLERDYLRAACETLLSALATPGKGSQRAGESRD